MKASKMEKPLNANSSNSREQLYVLAGHWKTDLEFYLEELHFFYQLLEKYLIWITKQENLEKAEKIRSQGLALRKIGHELLQKLSAHQKTLGNLIEQPEQDVPLNVSSDQAWLENELAGFLKQFRENRQATFEITEYIIDSESLPSSLQ